MQPDLMLKNLARGGKMYHGHRREIVRALLERNLGVVRTCPAILQTRQLRQPFDIASADP